MSFIEKWIFDRLGIQINIRSKFLGHQLFDGKLFYFLLKSYDCVGNELLYEPERKDSESAFNYLQKLCPYFKKINVPCDDAFLIRIVNKDNVQGLRMLFKMFLNLECYKIRILKETKSEVSCRMFPRIDELNEVARKELFLLGMKGESLQDNLARKKQNYKQEIGKNEATKGNPLMYVNTNVDEKMPSSIFEMNPAKLRMFKNLIDTTQKFKRKYYRQLTNLQSGSVADTAGFLSFSNLDKYLKLLKICRRELNILEKKTRKQQVKLLESLFHHIISSEEDVIKTELNHLIIKQSMYEKEIAQKLVVQEAAMNKRYLLNKN